MTKIIQLTAIIALISASSSYAWEWPNWRAWFAAPKPGPNYRKLEVKEEPTFSPKYPYPPTPDVKKPYLEIPSDLDPDQNYEIAKIGDEYWLKTTPSKKTVWEIYKKQYQRSRQIWRSKRIKENKNTGWLPERVYPKDIEKPLKTYIRPQGDTAYGELIT